MGVGVGGRFLSASAFFEPQQGYRWGEGRAAGAQGAGGDWHEGQHMVAVREVRAQWKCCLETKGPLVTSRVHGGRRRIVHQCDG